MGTKNDVPQQVKMSQRNANTVLDLVESAFEYGTVLEWRPQWVIKNARASLYAALAQIANSDDVCEFKAGECLIACLLRNDWSNAVRVAEAIPGAKTRLMQHFSISDSEWDALRRDPGLRIDPYEAALGMRHKLWSVLGSPHFADLVEKCEV